MLWVAIHHSVLVGGLAIDYKPVPLVEPLCTNITLSHGQPYRQLAGTV